MKLVLADLSKYIWLDKIQLQIYNLGAVVTNSHLFNMPQRGLIISYLKSGCFGEFKKLGLWELDFIANQEKTLQFDYVVISTHVSEALDF